MSGETTGERIARENTIGGDTENSSVQGVAHYPACFCTDIRSLAVAIDEAIDEAGSLALRRPLPSGWTDNAWFAVCDRLIQVERERDEARQALEAIRRTLDDALRAYDVRGFVPPPCCAQRTEGFGSRVAMKTRARITLADLALAAACVALGAYLALTLAALS